MTDGGDQAPRDLVGFLDHYLVQKAPFQIPENVREWIVRYGPWILLVLMVLSLPAVLVALGLSTILLPFAGIGYASGLGIVTIFVVGGFALRAFSLPGLFARRMSGWQLVFYATLIDIVGSLLSGSIVGGILSGLIGLYILFQIRTKYA